MEWQEDDNATMKLARDLAVAWVKYKMAFGESPHGTVTQLAAMLAFMPTSKSNEESAKERPDNAL